MQKYQDLVLQLIFTIALLGVVFLMINLRQKPLQAVEEKNSFNNYSNFQTIYQFEQEEDKLKMQINNLKIDYANSVNNYLKAQENLNSLNLSTLEYREKLNQLNQIYNSQYFQKKIDLIDEQQKILNNLMEYKCQKYCTYQDLPN